MDLGMIDEELKERLRREGSRLPVMWYVGKDDVAQPLLVVEIDKWPRKLDDKPPQLALPWTSLALLDLDLADVSIMAAMAAAKPVKDSPEAPNPEDFLRMAEGHMLPGEITAIIEIETRKDRGDEYTAVRMLPYVGGQQPGTAYFPDPDLFDHGFESPEMCDWINDQFIENRKDFVVQETEQEIQDMKKRPGSAWTAAIDVMISVFHGKVWADPALADMLDARFERSGLDDKGRIRLVWRDDYDPSPDLTVDGR